MFHFYAPQKTWNFFKHQEESVNSYKNLSYKFLIFAK